MDTQQKIFGIGLSKTGTTSLGVALNILGFNVKDFPIAMLHFHAPNLVKLLCDGLNWSIPRLNREILFVRRFLYGMGKNNVDFDYLAEFNATMDLPVGLYYRELDKYYPGSKFVLTVRDEKEWLESARKHFDPNRAPQRRHEWNRMRLDVYRSILFDEKKFLKAYRKHVANVHDYFKDRPNDLLIINIPSGDGWDALCSFTGKSIPREPFPHENKSSDRT